MAIYWEVGMGSGKPRDYKTVADIVDFLDTAETDRIQEFMQRVPGMDPVESVFRYLEADDGIIENIAKIIRRKPEFQDKLRDMYERVGFSGTPFYER